MCNENSTEIFQMKKKGIMMIVNPKSIVRQIQRLRGITQSTCDYKFEKNGCYFWIEDRENRADELKNYFNTRGLRYRLTFEGQGNQCCGWVAFS